MEWIRIHARFERESADVYLTILNVIYIPIFFRITYFLRFFLLNRSKIVGVFRLPSCPLVHMHLTSSSLILFDCGRPHLGGHKFYCNFLLVEFQNFWSVQQSLYFVQSISRLRILCFLIYTFPAQQRIYCSYCTRYTMRTGDASMKAHPWTVGNQFRRFPWIFCLNTFWFSALFSVWSVCLIF